MNDNYQITSVQQLEDTLGVPLEFIAQKVRNSLDAGMLDFIQRSPLVFLSTMDSAGRMDVSPKGDTPGFVKATDTGKLLLPDRPGNKLAYGFRNILNNSHIGMIFIVPHLRETLRVKGTATLSNDPALLEQLAAQGKPATLCTTIDVSECFFHCGKAMIRSKLWQPEHWQQPGVKSPMVNAMVKQFDADESAYSDIETALEDNYRDELY